MVTHDTLTAQEHRIMRALAQGLNSCQVGEVLGISPFTVRTHSERVRRKLRARNTTHAVALCYERGLFSDWPNGGMA